MRAVKGFLFVMAGFFVIITAISLLMPSTVVVNRSVNIATDSSSAAVQIRDLESWVNWHPYFSGAKPTKGRLANGNGYLQWESDGHVYRLEELIEYPNGIRVAFQREGENDIINDVTAYSAGLQNQVEWKAINKVKWYPWEKFGAMLLNDITGPGYEEALKSLKTYLEKR
jgi:hypothetical protein